MDEQVQALIEEYRAGRILKREAVTSMKTAVPGINAEEILGKAMGQDYNSLPASWTEGGGAAGGGVQAGGVTNPMDDPALRAGAIGAKPGPIRGMQYLAEQYPNATGPMQDYLSTLQSQAYTDYVLTRPYLTGDLAKPTGQGFYDFLQQQGVGPTGAGAGDRNAGVGELQNLIRLLGGGVKAANPGEAFLQGRFGPMQGAQALEGALDLGRGVWGNAYTEFEAPIMKALEQQLGWAAAKDPLAGVGKFLEEMIGMGLF